MTDAQGLAGLTVWQESITLAKIINQEVLPHLPEHEKWSLTSQLRRSSQSVSANIAEGYGRFYYQETIRFCYIARGSLEETYSHLFLAKELGYIEESIFSNLNNSIVNLKKLIGGYINYLKKTKQGAKEPGAGVYEHTVEYSPDQKTDQ
jgi:four helix bundle protein